MTVHNKLLFGLYFFIWTVFLALAYAFLTDRFYQVGRIFGPIFGIFTLAVTIIFLLALTTIYILKPIRRPIIKRKIVVCLIPLLFLIPFALMYVVPNNLETERHAIEVSYVVWMCDCANWALDVDNKKHFSGDAINQENIFIEPANTSLILPDTIGYNGDIIKLTGYFYSKKGFPKNYYSQELPDKARVFQYDSFKIIKSNYEHSAN